MSISPQPASADPFGPEWFQAARGGLADADAAILRQVPKEYLLDAHHWLILHGRYVCVARKPKCPQCPIADLCDYPDKTRLDAA